MMAHRAAKRLLSVENTCGSIVSAAAWVTLHAAQAPVIFAEIVKIFEDGGVGIVVKEALICVLHECVLSCVANAVVPKGKLLVLGSIKAVLPRALKGAVANESAGSSGVESFQRCVQKILSWWTSLELFDQVWLDECRETIAHGGDAGATNHGSGSAPSSSPTAACAATLGISIDRLLLQYRVLRRNATKRPREDDGAAYLELEALAKRITLALSAIQSAVASLEDVEVAGGLDGEAATGPQEPVSSDPLSTTLAPEDDVLGSFF